MTTVDTVNTLDTRGPRGSAPRAGVRNEFAKMRGLRMGALAALLVIGVVGPSVLSAVASPDFADPASRAWPLLLAGASLGMPLVAPLVMAVLASRLVDVEHQGNGWLSSATTGVPAGALCRAKIAALGALVTAATVVAGLGVIAAGTTLGFTGGIPARQWAGFIACMVVINVALLALHVLVAARVENQLVGLGLGLLGTLVALFASALPAGVARALPWGYYAAAQAADYSDGGVVSTPLSYPSIGVLGVVTGVVVVLATRRLDRMEA